MATKQAVAKAVKKWRGDKRSLTVFFDKEKDADLIEWIDCSPFPKSDLVKRVLRMYKEERRK